jgi:hypothetical protein
MQEAWQGVPSWAVARGRRGEEEGRREGGKEGRREGGKEGRREGGKEGRREGGKEGTREGGTGTKLPLNYRFVGC